MQASPHCITVRHDVGGRCDKAYVPGAKPRADMGVLNTELLDLVQSLRPSAEEKVRFAWQKCHAYV